LPGARMGPDDLSTINGMVWHYEIAVKGPAPDIIPYPWLPTPQRWALPIFVNTDSPKASILRDRPMLLQTDYYCHGLPTSEVDL
jgi:hypothetical protein